MEGYLRLSYCGTIKDITEGIERMKWALDPNAPNELYIGDRKLVRDWTDSPGVRCPLSPPPAGRGAGPRRSRP